MVRLSYSQLANHQFLIAIQRLAQRQLPVRAAYNVKKWADAITAAKKTVGEEYEKEILQAFAEKDEDGKFKFTNPDDPGSHVISEENKPKIKEANEKFGARMVDLPRQKLILEELGNLEISAADLGALDPILTEMSEIEEQRKGLKAVPSP